MKTLILGLGNPILSDDGIGHYVAQSLEERLNRPDVKVTQASVVGLDFLDLLTGYDRAIIIDAIQTRNGKVGRVYRLEPEAFDHTKNQSTPHHLNFATVLELGKRLSIPLPGKIVIYAIEVADVNTFSDRCTPSVERVIPVVTDMVMREVNGN
jgi:hydrogenase maturation protease